MATRRPQIWSWKFRWYICLILCSRFSSSVNRQPPPWVKDDTMYGLDVHAKCWDLSKQLQICFFGHVCHAFAIALWCSTWWYMTISYNKKNKSERSFISFHLHYNWTLWWSLKIFELAEAKTVFRAWFIQCLIKVHKAWFHGSFPESHNSSHHVVIEALVRTSVRASITSAVISASALKKTSSFEWHLWDTVGWLKCRRVETDHGSQFLINVLTRCHCSWE